MLAVCFEVFTIACTGLKEESPISLSFWSYIFGITFSLFFFHFLFDHTVIPDNTIDIILYFEHAVLVSGITYFDIIALQNIDVSLYCIASNVT